MAVSPTKDLFLSMNPANIITLTSLVSEMIAHIFSSETPKSWSPIFSDTRERAEPRGQGKYLFIFIFRCPYPYRYKQSMKASFTFRYIVPTWSYLELLFMNPDDRDWIDRFIMFCGVPRNVLWYGFGRSPESKSKEVLMSLKSNCRVPFQCEQIFTHFHL